MKKLVILVLILFIFSLSTTAFAVETETNSITSSVDLFSEYVTADEMARLKVPEPFVSPTPLIAEEINSDFYFSFETSNSPISNVLEDIALEDIITHNAPESNSNILNAIPHLQSQQTIDSMAAQQTPQSSQAQYGIPGGQYGIASDTLYNGKVFSATDVQIYVHNVTTAGDYTAYVGIPSTGMNYAVSVVVIDQNGQQISLLESSFPSNLYNGHRLRVAATPGQTIAIAVGSNNPTFLDETYLIGLFSTATSQRDEYEINDNLANSLETFSVGTTITATTDNPADMDWYIFDCSGTYNHGPLFDLNSSGNYAAIIWKQNNDSTITPLYTLNSSSSELKLPSGKGIYYISILSANGGTGSYTLSSRAETITNIASVDVRIWTDFWLTHSYPGIDEDLVFKRTADVIVTVKDAAGNPIPNCDVYLLEGNLNIPFNEITEDQYIGTTGLNGVMAYQYTLPLADTWRNSATSGNNRFLYNSITMRVAAMNEVSGSSLNGTFTIYQYYGEVYRP